MTLKKKMPPLESFVDDMEDLDQGVKELDVSKLDLFAMFASSAVAKKMDDPARIAHESYQIALKMKDLSMFYKGK
jgi:hypothetical protein